MMNAHERLNTFLSGECPDQIPYTIYYSEWSTAKHDPAWKDMFDKGLLVTWHSSTFERNTPGLEYLRDEYVENGKRITRVSYRTSIGEIFELYEDGWKQKFALVTPEDYKIMTHIVENTKIKPCYEVYYKLEQQIASFGIPLLTTDRTPLQRILVDMVGLDNFSIHLFDFEEEIITLYEALLKQYGEIVDVVAAGPGRYVSVLENFTAETLGPQRFAKFHVPVYEEFFPILQAKGKVVGNHYDGRLRSCKEHINKAPIDIIESLTPPNEGDMTLDECRREWPDKLFWSNIKVSDYNLPPRELNNRVLDLVGQASPDGRRLAFEVSEQLPANWRESMPVVINALRETQR